jgi:hypothetical protein
VIDDHHSPTVDEKWQIWREAAIPKHEFNAAVDAIRAMLPDRDDGTIRSVLYGLVIAGYRFVKAE